MLKFCIFIRPFALIQVAYQGQLHRITVHSRIQTFQVEKCMIMYETLLHIVSAVQYNESAWVHDLGGKHQRYCFLVFLGGVWECFWKAFLKKNDFFILN